MRILFATDGSRAAESALERLPALLGLKGASDLSVVMVAISSSAGERRSQTHGDAARALAALERSKQILARRGLVPKSIWRIGQDAAGTILELVDREHPDVLVVGTAALVSARGELRPVSDELARRSPIPVIAIR